MIANRKVVACTPAGRREFMEVLIPYVLREKQSGAIDEYHLWINTVDEEDIAYIKGLAKLHPDFIRIIKPDPSIVIDPKAKGYSIYQFFKNCIEPGVVYVRLDDDIVFIERGAIRTLVEFRIQNPQYFLVYANVVNNAVMSHLHQRFGMIDRTRGLGGYWCLDQIGWGDPKFGELVHRWFFHHYQSGNLAGYKQFDRWEANAFERISINCISWLGEEFAEFDGDVGVDEEQWLSVDKPLSISKMNCICGQALVSHFSFYTQMEHLITTDILDKYRNLCQLENQEIADRDKLFQVIGVLLSAPIDRLTQVSFLEQQIRLMGLHPDNRNLYGEDNRYQNRSQGAWQIPRQLAEFLVCIQKFRINKYLDVGTFNGYTCAFITAVLKRFNPELKVTAIDPQKWWDLYPEVASLLPIEYLHQTTERQRGCKYDLVFIDGDHQYGSVIQDYENVGKEASLCAFHDCNDDYIINCPFMNGGVPRAWAEVKTQDNLIAKEFFSHSEAKDVMGIGLLINMSGY